MVRYFPGMVYAHFHVPDARIRFFVQLSGFSKSEYLEPTGYGEFLDTKIFPDNLYPGPSFALNQPFSDIFLNSILWPKLLEIILLMVFIYKELTWIIFNFRGNTIGCSGLLNKISTKVLKYYKIEKQTLNDYKRSNAFHRHFLLKPNWICTFSQLRE